MDLLIHRIRNERQIPLFYLDVAYHDTRDDYYYKGSMGLDNDIIFLYQGTRFNHTLSMETLENRLR